ncbi:MAG: REP-associated tyrosine transposase [Rubrobacteraceae bacterium]
MSIHDRLFEEERTKHNGPVECLGMSFENDAARREYFLERLRERLADPEFRRTEGFPKGSDEDILALSDPPFYTACPNPFVGEFVEFYGMEYDAGSDDYRREPFAADVSEGKNDPIYNAHSYHTKVPHKAIMRYILHYTEPGDIVFDGFCGTGMTGVAAQLSGDRKAVAALGYTVTEGGDILDDEGRAVSKLGARRAVLNDLSPAATFISYNYNTPVDVEEFEREANRILEEVEAECGWMYWTLHVEPASSRPEQSEPEYQRGITTFTARQDNLPHWQQPGAFYFLTFNTADHRKLSREARSIVLDALRHWNGKRLRFIGAVVMPDHVHAVIQPLEKSTGEKPSAGSRLHNIYWDLSDIMHSVKSFSANEINKVEGTLGRTVWRTETYDRIVRDDREFGHVLEYIAQNPVKEGLARTPEEYEWFVVGDEVDDAGWKPAPLGRINYTAWSDVFVCSECAGEVVFWEAAVDKEAGKVRDVFACPHCSATLKKKGLGRAWQTRFDEALGETARQARQVPVMINYSVGPASSRPGQGKQKRFEKTPDDFDRAMTRAVEETPIPHWFPTDAMMHVEPGTPWGDEWRPGRAFEYIHHLSYTRAFHILGRWQLAATPTNHLGLVLTAALTNCTRMYRWRANQKGGTVSGTFYLPSTPQELNSISQLEGKVKTFASIFGFCQESNVVATQSTTQLIMPTNSVDYIFTDPPFGGNLMYSELNFLWESWLKVFTNNVPEAIENKIQGKGLLEYQELMSRCFEEYHRVLKPGRWMTVEFHNSKNSVWNAIQESLQRAGFVVADVRTLDKKQGTFKQTTSAAAVKQDLVISAYKPNEELERRFDLEAGTEAGVWDFVDAHLRQLRSWWRRAMWSLLPAGLRVSIQASKMLAPLLSRWPKGWAISFSTGWSPSTCSAG